MMLKFECQYCGHRWEQQYYSKPTIVICSKCKDTNIKMEEKTSGNVFGYEEE